MTREAAVQTIRDTYSPTSRDDDRAIIGTRLMVQAMGLTADWLPPPTPGDDRIPWRRLRSDTLERMAELCLDREQAYRKAEALYAIR